MKKSYKNPEFCVKNLKKYFLASILFFAGLSLFAADVRWYVCTGSFSNQDNARILRARLESENIETRILEYEKDGTLFYRVIIDKPFYFLNAAKDFKNAVSEYPFIKQIGIKNLWICEAPYVPESAPVLKEPEPVRTAAVEVGDRPLEETVLPPEPVLQETSLENTGDSPLELIETEPAAVSEEAVFEDDGDSPIENAVENEEIVLSTNENDISFGLDRPYSVLVRSYKEESVAESNKKRLLDKDIDAYILKTFDDENYLNFNLHAGAFENPDDAEALQNKLEDLGIENTNISDYRDIAAKIQDYNQLVSDSKITYENEVMDEKQIEQMFSSEVLKTIRQFPINQNFQLEGISIADFDNINYHSKKEILGDEITALLVKKEDTHAASFSIYRDGLFDNNVAIFIETANPGDFEISDFEEKLPSDLTGVEFNLMVKDGLLNCQLYFTDDMHVLIGVNQDKSMIVVMVASGFEGNEFDEFLNDLNNDSSYLVYPQLRRNLFVLPKPNENVDRDFLYFTLEKTGENYARERNYAAWAYPIVGHWSASAYFIQDDIVVSIGFFDMEYDYLAKTVFQMFMKAHWEETINEDNYSPDYDKADSWYLGGSYIRGTNEFSFSKDSYIIAIDSVYPYFNEYQLMDFADDLKIWDEE